LKLSTKILIGLAGGLAVGLFFGEPAGVLRIVGEVFVGLLQMTVLPYVMVSLIAGLGRLQAEEAKKLAARGGLILLTLWGVALATVAVFPIAFPVQESASFFSRAMVEERPPFDFLNLYVPSNPFRSMANTIMPAVVMFSIAVGVALIGMESKQKVIEQLEIWSGALMRITKAVTKLAPYGVFAIAASAAGTMPGEDAGRLQVFLLTYVLAAVVLAFWVLPALVTALTPIGYRDLFDTSREAIVTAFATGNLLVVLPMLAQGAKDALERSGKTDEEARMLVDILTPTSFTFPHAGKLLGLSFVPFVGWFLGQPIPFADYPMMLSAGLASLFGHIVVAIPFMLDLTGQPDDMFQLFLSVDVFIKPFRMLVATTHTLAFTLLATFAMQGMIKVQWRRIGQIALVTLALMIGVFGGARLLFQYTLGNEYNKDKVLANMEFLDQEVEATVHTEPPPTPEMPLDPRPSRLTLIRSRGAIRVGYFPDHLPYSYFNPKGELIGLDVEMAHTLAAELNLRPEFVPVDPDRLAEQLYSGYCDVVMSGVVVTTERAQEIAFTRPVLEVTLGFLVSDRRRKQFNELTELRDLISPTIGVWNHYYYMSKVRQLLPTAEIVPVPTSRELQGLIESGTADFDAFLMPAEEAAAWSLYYPHYSVAIPKPLVMKVPLAYALDQDSEDLQNLLNTWVQLKQSDGTLQRLYDHWILGKWAVPEEPRWSVMRNVLGWGKDRESENSSQNSE
jgi:Na+/H+-dicarboxylate symporter